MPKLKPKLKPEFFERLRASLVDDCRAAITEHLSGADKSPVYAFVVCYHPMHGYVGWQIHTQETERKETRGFTYPPGHPDGSRYYVGDAFDASLSSKTEALLEDYG